MATRAVSFPRLGVPAARSARRDRVALPLVCLLVVSAATASLGVALARLPSRLAAPAEPRVALSAARLVPDDLDAIAPITDAAMPRSPHPVGGFAFVRCTNLWTAYADGSNARRILTMPGISSPTFSPDGRTIAFLSATSAGTEIWLAAADGSGPRQLGTVSDEGAPVRAAVGSLGWSPDGSRLSLAITPLGIRRGTTTHWALSLSTGLFQKVGEGGDAPVWLGRQLLAAGRADGRVDNLWGNRWTANRLSRAGDVLALGLAPGWWAWEWEKQTALLLRDGAGSLELGWRRGPSRTRSAFVADPPEGYRFDPSGRPAVVQYGPVAVTLLDRDGQRDLGLFDPTTLRWDVLDYAWDPAWSPAPAALGGIEERRAVLLVQNLLWHLEQPQRADLLLESPLEPDVAPFRRLGYTFEEPVRRAGGWSIRAHTFGQFGEGFATRDLDVLVSNAGGRVAASVEPVGPLERLRSVDDAVAYLERILTVRVVGPAGLPEGTTLAARALDAWSWRGKATGSLNVNAPGIGRLTFYYGASGFGCGASPIPVELSSGTPAIVTDPTESGGYNIIAWPAQPKDSSGPFGIWGNVSTTELVRIASATDAARLAS